MKIHYKGEACYHAGAGIDLVPGDMDVTEEQAKQLAPILGGAKDSAYHAANGDVYHTDPSCVNGNNVEARNRRKGTGGLVSCPLCVRPDAAPSRMKKE